LGGLRPQLLVCSLHFDIPPLDQLLCHLGTQLQLPQAPGMLSLRQE
jgi:hypothetical protein